MAEIYAGHPIVELFNAIRRDNQVITAMRFSYFMRHRGNMSREQAGYHHINRAFNKNGWANRGFAFGILCRVIKSIGLAFGVQPILEDGISGGQFVEFFKRLDNGEYDHDNEEEGQWYQENWGMDAVDSLKELRTYAYDTWGPGNPGHINRQDGGSMRMIKLFRKKYLFLKKVRKTKKRSNKRSRKTKKRSRKTKKRSRKTKKRSNKRSTKRSRKTRSKKLNKRSTKRSRKTKKKSNRRSRRK